MLNKAEFRSSDAVSKLLDKIRKTQSQGWSIMEICGGQTHAFLQYGLDQLLPQDLQLIHGPGCPVCVTPLHLLQQAIDLAYQEQVIMCSFGDMLRVPAYKQSLAQAKARGANIELVYSPLEAVQVAARESSRQVVMFAIGFETTTPLYSLALQQASQRGLKNFSLLTALVRVQPALEAMLEDTDCGIDGVLAAGHVCAVTGYSSYQSVVQKFNKPIVVTGFEPVDLLLGLFQVLDCLENSQASLKNAYTRAVTMQGNPHARQAIEQYFEPCDQSWRGFGVISAGGYRLRAPWSEFDAGKRFFSESHELGSQRTELCPASAVLTGRIKPVQCPYFGKECTSDHPLGAPMVSAEGSCAAYFQAGRRRKECQ